jgi:ATP-dependent DNA helicase RecQ
VPAFRSAQREVLESIFSGHSTLGNMPTGAEKSLTYQLAALFLLHTV